MRTFLFALCLTLLTFGAVPALAVISTSDLSSEWKELNPAQKAEMAQLIAQKAAEAQKPLNQLSAVRADDVEPWLDLVDRVGIGLVKLAHSLGVEANELVATPVGVIVVGLVAYTVMGQDLLSIGVGLLWFAISFPVWLLLFYKLVIPVVDYREIKKSRFYADPVTVQKPIRRKVTFHPDNPSGPEWIVTILLLVGVLIPTAVLLAQ